MEYIYWWEYIYWYSHVFACILMYSHVSWCIDHVSVMYRSYVTVMYWLYWPVSCMYRVRVRNGQVSAMYRDVSIETIWIVPWIVYRIRVSWPEVDTRLQNLRNTWNTRTIHGQTKWRIGVRKFGGGNGPHFGWKSAPRMQSAINASVSSLRFFTSVFHLDPYYNNTNAACTDTLLSTS